MIDKARKRKIFFDNYGKLIKSRVSRIPASAEPRSDTIKRVLSREKDTDLIEFIEVSGLLFYLFSNA